MNIHDGHQFGFIEKRVVDHVGSQPLATHTPGIKRSDGQKKSVNNSNVHSDPVQKVNAMNSFHDFYSAVVHKGGGTSTGLNLRKDIKNGDKRDLSRSNFADVHKYPSKSKQTLTEAQRIEIELKMRRNADPSLYNKTNIKEKGDKASTALYKYKPSHIIFNEMCMILQCRVFDINPTAIESKKDANNINVEHYHHDTVREISLGKYETNKPNHLRVYDIAFGLPGSNNSTSIGQTVTNEKNRPRALWFHIQAEDIQHCTLQERMNYKRTSKKLEKLKRIQDEKSAKSLRTFKSFKHNSHLKTFDLSYDLYESGAVEKTIIMNFPMDKDSLDLTTEVLHHRLLILKGSEDRKSNDKILMELEKKFDALKLHLNTFCFWPINDGREKVDKTTLVPMVEGTYSVPVQGDGKQDEFAFQKHIWDSYVESVSFIYYHHFAKFVYFITSFLSYFRCYS
jgi:hypothetical protein